MNGDNMTEEPCIKTELAEAKAEVESLSLKLSELKETNSELEGQIAELRKEKEGMELVLSETKENLEILAKREYDEEVDLILSLDSEYPLKGDETMDELELILTALRRSSERRKSLVGDKNKEDMTATSVVNELKELTGRIR
jgi:chromosome segregation ATPase